MHQLSVTLFLANLLVILLSAKVFGALAHHGKQPAVLGELLGGVLLGFGLVSFFHPNDPVLSLMAEFGVILLLFQTGLECNLHELLKVGPIAVVVALMGVALPLVAGYGLMRALGHSSLQAVFVGAALTASSVGITARVLSELGKLTTPEGQIILGAAIIDDILGVILLSGVQRMADGGKTSWPQLAWTGMLAISFIGVALWLGPSVSKRLVDVAGRFKAQGTLITATVCFAFAMALLAHALGTALIVGAFTAGILLAQTDRKADIESSLQPVADIFVPIFFVMVGASIELSHYNPVHRENWSVLELAALLIGLAIVTKLVSGWAAWKKGLNRWAIGSGMIPRGEVGLIFAQVGLASAVIDKSLYAALVAMVVMTTFVTPPLLTWALTDAD